MSRPIWKGYITFGLVNIPVILYSAEKKFDISFHLIDSRDKSRIRYVRTNEHTGHEVPWEKIVKGYEYDDDNYVLLSEKELKEIAGENTKSINIENFISTKYLNCMSFERPYYLVPDKKAEKGYVILREILAKTHKVGIAKVIIHTRQYLAALMPYGNALVLNLMRYAQELRQPEEFDLPTENLKTYKISNKELQIATKLVDSMTSKWNPEEYHDEYREALQKWIEEKVEAKKPHTKMKHVSKSTKTNVINFMDLLQKSLKQKKLSSTKKPSTRKRKKA